jgi:serine phosphatase RsbU (regulator of sigma subunit)
VLGLVEDSTYEQGSVPFRPDDLFVFYSDGITDRANPEGELFGVERLKEAAARTAPTPRPGSPSTRCSARSRAGRRAPRPKTT